MTKEQKILRVAEEAAKPCNAWKLKIANEVFGTDFSLIIKNIIGRKKQQG